MSETLSEFFGTAPPKCTCVEREHTYVFNPNPGIKCRKHPACIFEHPEYNPKLKTWIFPKQNTFELGGVIKTNGMLAFKIRCVGCGKTSSELKKTDFLHLCERGIPYTWTRDTYAHADTHVCQVKGCGSTDIEWHHFAPRNTFPDADNWPYLPICREHHRQWHLTMDGYRFQAAKDAEPWHGKAASSA